MQLTNFEVDELADLLLQHLDGLTYPDALRVISRAYELMSTYERAYSERRLSGVLGGERA